MRTPLTLLAFLLSFFVNSQDYFEPKTLQLADKVYEKNIKTVTLKPYSDPYGLPIIRLNSVDALRLDFDALGFTNKNYGYTVIHCTHDWQPSDLIKAEYINGMHDYYMQDFEFSINTYVPYTHYRLSVPNQNMQLTKSGNYVLIIYQNDDKNDIVLTRRFMLYEERVNVGGNVVRATNLEERDTHQQLNFIISHGGYQIPNPFIDLNVTVMQNGRWDNALTGLKPKFMRNDQLDYNFEGENSFSGGNEFRNFDTKQLTELTMNIRKTVLDTIYTAFLIPEAPRTASRYSFFDDINGRFVVRRLNSSNPDAEADYAWIDFFLSTDKYTEGNVYVFGQLSDWRVNPKFMLRYDEQTHAYRGQILLKQGYYNYQYVVLPDNSRIADETLIEGSHWETTNEYSILVYHREIGIRYDRLVGLTQFFERPFR